MGKKAVKKVPQAPLAVKVETKVKKSTPFEKRTRNFRIGGDILPQRDLTRFTKWPQYVRLQRQKRIMLQRIKVPPAIAQFGTTVDSSQFGQLNRLCKKLAPESKAAKKDRLRQQAEAQKAGKKFNPGKPTFLKYGLNHVTELVENKKAKLVLIAHDVDPVEIVCWLPQLCRKKDVPFCIVKGKSRLGKMVGKKSATAVAITNVEAGQQGELNQLCENFRSMFNENVELKRRWGGGILGVKSAHVERRHRMVREAEMNKKAGLRM